MTDYDYRINYQIFRSVRDAEEFEEIGFGSVDSGTVDYAAYEIGIYLERREWETEPGQPDPAEVDA